MRIVGIDPGSRYTGYGIIDSSRQSLKHVAHGVIAVKKTSLASRLYEIYDTLKDILSTYQPNSCAVEEVFVGKNIQSALKLGQARGAALCAVAYYDLEVAEYSTRLVKQAVVGYGAAEKSQVGQMVQFLLKLESIPKEDASDALAVAICHASTTEVFV